MEPALADRIRQTQSSFPAEKPGAVAQCPFKETAAETPPPVEVKTAYALTQEIMKTMSGGKPLEKPKQKKAWIEIILVDAEGKPMPGVRYRVTPPGGEAVEGTLNEHGQAGLYQIEPGNCKITFPDLDKEAWE